MSTTNPIPPFSSSSTSTSGPDADAGGDNPASSSSPERSTAVSENGQIHTEGYDPLASDPDFHPISHATITVRIIKSFGYRTFKGLVLRDMDLGSITVGQLKERCLRDIKTTPGFKAYRSLQLDTLKLYTVAHGSKTTNLIINLDHDEWILSDPSRTLAEIGARNETELSFFNRQDYEAFKANPEVKWD